MSKSKSKSTSVAKVVDIQRPVLVRCIEEGFNRKAWHGPNLRGSIRRVDAAMAAWRPAAGRHSIAEVVVHCAYWKYAVRRRIRDDLRASFVLKGSNWFALPDKLTEAEWKGYVKILDREHVNLLDAVTTLPELYLRRTRDGVGQTIGAHVHGIAMHDVYHAGQIQTIKALYKSRG